MAHEMKLNKRPRVYYVICGTKGKVDCSYFGGIDSTNKMVIILDKDGESIGWNPIEHTFFTAKQAINDWRRRSSAETTEHADVLEKVADEIREKAEKIRKSARTIGKWQDL